MAQSTMFDILEKLSDDRKNIIYKLALDMLCAQQAQENFDYYSPDDIKAINEARERTANGDHISLTVEEFTSRFGA